MSDAARKAELLFETSTVAEIREVRCLPLQSRSPRQNACQLSDSSDSSRSLCVVHPPKPVCSDHGGCLRTAAAMPVQVETKADAEIEEKKVALRQLVGDSYRCARP